MRAYNEETIQTCEEILNYLYENRDKHIKIAGLILMVNPKINNKSFLASEDKIKESLITECCNIIVKRGFADLIQKHKLLKINLAGIHFHEQGGFNGEQERIHKKQEQELTDQKAERELRSTQIKELKNRLASVEKQMKEQSDFFTSSTKRNNIQVFGIGFTALLALASFIVSILAYCK